MAPITQYALLLTIIYTACGVAVHTSITAEHGSHCPASPPCSCDGIDIRCDGSNLSSVPIFEKQQVKYPWQLDLSDNKISEIKSNAFKNLPLASLQMSNNGLMVIADDAFTGSEHTLSRVSLQNNKLSELPYAIGRLRNITMLNVHNNPMTLFPESIFRNISITLQFLDIGSEEMTTWPTSIGYLKSLFSLTIYNLPVPDLPLDAFSGLEQLLLLDFRSTMLQTVPIAVNRLSNLQGISFNDNVKLTSAGFSSEVFANMPNFMDIIIVNSSLSTMPDFSKVINIRSITVMNCGLETWEDNTLANPTTLSNVGLNDTKFITFPSIISRLANLKVLSMSYSQFQEIPSGTFQKLQDLAHLELDSTPIKDISDNAFDGNPKLQQIILDDTGLTAIPKAIEKLSSLRYINMWNDPLDCTCETMGWLKHWKRLPFVLASGNCKNLNETTLSTYTTEYVPKCPDM